MAYHQVQAKTALADGLEVEEVEHLTEAVVEQSSYAVKQHSIAACRSAMYASQTPTCTKIAQRRGQTRASPIWELLQLISCHITCNKDLRNNKEAEPSDGEEIGPHHRVSISVPVQSLSLFNLPSDYRMQGEIRNREAVGEQQLLQHEVGVADTHERTETRAAPDPSKFPGSFSPAFMDNLDGLDTKVKKTPPTKIKKQQTLSLVGEDGLLRMLVKKERW